MRKFSALFILVLIFSMLLVACGGGGGGSGASTSIKTVMTEFKFDPNEWTVPAGQEITLDLTNSGTVEHDWVLMVQPAVAPFDEADQPNVSVEFDAPIGESTSVTFTAPTTAGDYQVVCSVPGHLEAGMTGTLHVTQ